MIFEDSVARAPVHLPDQLDRESDTPLAGRAYDVIRNKILRGHVAPGAKLKVNALQEDLGISSSPLREALNRLLSDGLVQADGYTGFRACPLTAGDLEDLTAHRLIVELAAIRQSVLHGDDDWEAGVVSTFHSLEKIEVRVLAGTAARDDVWTERHKAFHLALVSAAASQRTISSCAALFDQSERYRHLSVSLRSGARNTLNEHRKIMQASLQRDVDKAERLLRVHILTTANNVLASIKRPTPPVSIARRKVP